MAECRARVAMNCVWPPPLCVVAREREKERKDPVVSSSNIGSAQSRVIASSYNFRTLTFTTMEKNWDQM